VGFDCVLENRREDMDCRRVKRAGSLEVIARVV
jgi:hypothetical protein